jgi:predicted RNase H-like nuclease (RuvC/YqgF family)
MTETFGSLEMQITKLKERVQELEDIVKEKDDEIERLKKHGNYYKGLSEIKD